MVYTECTKCHKAKEYKNNETRNSFCECGGVEIIVVPTLEF